MKNPLPNFTRLYESVLSTYLTEGFQFDGESIEKISKQANFQNLKSLKIAAIHEQSLVIDLLPGNTARSQTSLVRHAGTFFAGIENVDSAKLIAIYRVAQEALTNVDRHANASRVHISIIKEKDTVRMEIADDGKSFQMQEVMMRKGRKNLGLLGMRERIEMIGGSFEIDSSPGNGTTITACIPNKIKPNRKVR